MKTKLESLLRDQPAFANTVNLYGRDSDGDVRFHNLEIYLNKLASISPKCILIGEAPGYQGTLATGVPFTSEFLLMREDCPHDIHGGRHGYKLIDETERLRKEPSATIVWRTLDELPSPPLIWAAFPMHPHKPGNPKSNRPPLAAELTYGHEVLKTLMEQFPSLSKIVAVGNVAEKLLLNMGYSPTKVRHPSHGGATEFSQQLHEFYASI